MVSVYIKEKLSEDLKTGNFFVRRIFYLINHKHVDLEAHALLYKYYLITALIIVIVLIVIH